jgi:hypothetical protein
MRVFLSYRRDDASGHAGRLHDDLVGRLGAGSVFQDVVSIGPGERYRRLITEAIDGADVVIAVIGRQWSATDPQGRSRLSDADDVVRAELETALSAQRRVVPVLVDRATLPSAESLPESLRPMRELNAIELRDEAWATDLDRLYAAIGVPRRPTGNRRSVWLTAAVTAVVAVVAVLVALSLRDSGDGADSPEEPPIAAPTDAPQALPPRTAVNVQQADADGTVSYELRQWWTTGAAAGQSIVTVDMKLTNNTPDAISIYKELFQLRAGKVPMDVPSISVLRGAEGAGKEEESSVGGRYQGVSAERPLELYLGSPQGGHLVLSP